MENIKISKEQFEEMKNKKSVNFIAGEWDSSSYYGMTVTHKSDELVVEFADVKLIIASAHHEEFSDTEYVIEDQHIGAFNLIAADMFCPIKYTETRIEELETFFKENPDFIEHRESEIAKWNKTLEMVKGA